MSAHRALVLAIGELNDAGDLTPCQTLPDAWTADTAATATAEWAAERCGLCPVLGLCAAAAAEIKPTWGTWAAVNYDRRNARSTRKERP